MTRPTNTTYESRASRAKAAIEDISNHLRYEIGTRLTKYVQLPTSAVCPLWSSIPGL
jgi:hypothetical protein